MNGSMNEPRTTYILQTMVRLLQCLQIVLMGSYKSLMSPHFTDEETGLKSHSELVQPGFHLRVAYEMCAWGGFLPHKCGQLNLSWGVTGEKGKCLPVREGRGTLRKVNSKTTSAPTLLFESLLLPQSAFFMRTWPSFLGDVRSCHPCFRVRLWFTAMIIWACD